MARLASHGALLVLPKAEDRPQVHEEERSESENQKAGHYSQIAGEPYAIVELVKCLVSAMGGKQTSSCAA